MSDRDDSNTPPHIKARLAFNAALMVLRELGSDPKFSEVSSVFLGGCDKLQRIIREDESAH